MLRNRGWRIKAKKLLYEGVIVPTTLYVGEACSTRSAERGKVNVLEMKCLRIKFCESVTNGKRYE